MYEEATDDKQKKETALPPLEVSQDLKLNKLSAEQKFTQPPPYYTEATLIHALEEKGRIYVLRPEEEAIGRMEKKYEVLEGFYEHGYHLMERDFDKMTEYLGK